MALTKSERVRVIQGIDKHLAGEESTFIDLVLNQFGFPTTDHWSGSTNSYVIEMIRGGTDDDLVELSEHFGLKTSLRDTATSRRPTPYWEDGKIRVFISHLNAEKVQATAIKDVFGRYGMSGFVAHEDIHPTTEWQTEIETALSTCELLVALIHPDFGKSVWCDQEVGYALGRGVPVFAVRCGADPHGFVSRFQAFNGNNKAPFQIAIDIFEAALKHSKLEARMAGIAVELFATSDSYSAARKRIGYLEALTVWDPSFSTRITGALSANNQISGATGVSSRIAALTEKWHGK